jgi:hypothetical protein
VKGRRRRRRATIFGMASSKKTKVYLETGKKKTFAMALDWPGWGRSGRTADEALEALGEYASRYAPVAKKAKFDLPAGAGDGFTVVEEVKGNATTDFGAPAMFVKSDFTRVTAKEAERMAALVQAAWDTLAKVAKVSPQSLTKGPRGGGRDRDKMLDHVLSTESAYARKIGVKHKGPAIDDETAIKAMRADLLAVIGEKSDGKLLVPKGWPVAYTARRIAWHALDHAWEMQDRDPRKKKK